MVTTHDMSTKTSTNIAQSRGGGWSLEVGLNVVYMIQCRKFGQQYVGETGQALHFRLNNHRADIIHKKKEEKPVAAPYNNQGHSVEDRTVMVIEKLWKDDPVLRKIRENKWMRTQDTSHPI